ncbi:hypothetical protein A9Z42_0031640 [Trichoderma parareesei]|uniref:Uncharacterized protein n=1 Tax=Trichoderma parareesei TaxID=858221 RepID=A0A2H2ZRP9_TRIPA|nr:hypothetical protein A9Z42_0031640 [Trichoderma parareesei]
MYLVVYKGSLPAAIIAAEPLGDALCSTNLNNVIFLLALRYKLRRAQSFVNRFHMVVAQLPKLQGPALTQSFRMHEALLGDANRERLKAIQSVQNKVIDLNLEDASTRLQATAALEALRDTGLELFSHLDALLANQAKDEENPSTEPVLASSAISDEDVSHARSLIGPVVEKLLNLSNDAVNNEAQSVNYTIRSLAAEVGLALLTLISLLQPSSSIPLALDNAALIHLVPYTDDNDPWTTAQSARLAARLLETSLTDDDDEKRDTFIIQTLLNDTLRPQFAKSSSSTKLTPSGRPLQVPHQPSGRQAGAQLDSLAQEHEKLHAASSFKWAVTSCSQAAIARHWPLFLPILLSLAEDISTAVRAKGLKILLIFLDKCPPNTILSAGVDNVIQDAVFPTLLFLPDTTPESESLQLLYPAYQVLLRVAQLDPTPKSARRRKSLDRLLRDGVFTGHFHASQHVRIVEVLMIVIKDIVSGMGLFSAKYLQRLLRLFSATLYRLKTETESRLI